MPESEPAEHVVCERGKHFLCNENKDYIIGQCTSLIKVPKLSDYTKHFGGLDCVKK